MITELVYDGAARESIAKRWPGAKFTDADDCVREGCFEVEVDCDDTEFYVEMISNGFAAACFTFTLMLGMPEEVEKIRGWVAAAKAEPKAEGGR